METLSSPCAAGRIGSRPCAITQRNLKLIISLNYNIKRATKYDFLQGRLKGYPIPGLAEFHRSRPVL